MLSDELVVFDNLASRIFLIVHVDPAENEAWESGQKRLLELENKLMKTRLDRSFKGTQQSVGEDDFTSEFTQ